MSTQNTYTPLDGLERVKLTIYFILLLVASAFLGWGVLQSLLVLVGLYIMKKDNNFNFIRKSKLAVKVLLFIPGVFLIVSAFNFAIDRGLGIDANLVYFIWFLVTGLAFLLASMNYFFYSVIFKHEEWILKNGIFAEEEKEISVIDKVNTKLNKASLSSTIDTADAVLKYNELLEKGLITQEQFEKKRDELFN